MLGDVQWGHLMTHDQPNGVFSTSHYISTCAHRYLTIARSDPNADFSWRLSKTFWSRFRACLVIALDANEIKHRGLPTE